MRTGAAQNIVNSARRVAHVPAGRFLLVACVAAGIAFAVRLSGTAAGGGLLMALGAAVLLGTAPLPRPATNMSRDSLTGLSTRKTLVDGVSGFLNRPGQSAQTALLLAELDDFRLLEEAHDRATVERLLRHIALRLQRHLRDDDIAARLEGPVFAIALTPTRRMSLESILQLATRLQHAMAEPFPTGCAAIRVSLSIGFAIADRVEEKSGNALLQAATSALVEAQRSGPGAVRSYSTQMRERIQSRNALVEDVSDALRLGQITAFFQPQLCLETGTIAGFETLTRWQHPTRGLVSPAEFLPALRQAGRMEDLGDLMVRHALAAMIHWDSIGAQVPRVGVNFSAAELRNPRLVDRIAMHLDAHGIAPDRLVVEVLETVVANSSDDVVVRNLAGLSELGCGIDLDDFGTGYASITTIRRLSIGRIKIDRSFIARIDSDPEQQAMVAAILTMAERLGLDTLAEGVETPAERNMLQEIGCEYAQGFLFARPMPLEETDAWIATQQIDTADPVPLHRRTG